MSDIPVLTVERALELADEVVAEFGADHVYATDEARCVYVDDDDMPSCLVGNILHRHGCPIDLLREWDEDDEEDPAISSIGRDQPWLPDDTLIKLSIMQGEQDRGAEWGDAVNDAKRYNR